MLVRISRTWQLSNWPQAKLDAGQVFAVPPSLAIYLLALGCAELLPSIESESGETGAVSPWIQYP